MADNFRNKQWFKKLSQDRKNEICKKFDIDEKTLKKAGRETEDGRIVINLLKIDYLLHRPEIWKQCYDLLKNFKMTFNEITLSDIEVCKKFYKTFFPNTEFLKYKESLHNNLLVSYAYQYIKNWYLKYIDSEATIEEKEYYAYQVWAHTKMIIESDLQLVKEN